MASLMARRWVGLVMTTSMDERSQGGLPVHIRTGVAGERSLMMWAISPPVMPCMELSVKTRSWRTGLKRSRASPAEFAESTSYPKLLRNILVRRRVSTSSSTRSTVLNWNSIFCCTIFWSTGTASLITQRFSQTGFPKTFQMNDQRHRPQKINDCKPIMVTAKSKISTNLTAQCASFTKVPLPDLPASPGKIATKAKYVHLVEQTTLNSRCHLCEFETCAVIMGT
jgi:hypothetical protein